MTTRSWSASFAVLVTAASVSACGGSSGSEASGKAEPIEWSKSCDDACQQALTLTADPMSIDCTVGISQNSLKHPYGVAQKAGLENAAKRYFPNMKTFSTDGQGDAVTQSSQVYDLISRGIDVLLITPLEADSLVPAVEAAKEAGIKVITHDRTVNTDVQSELLDSNLDAGKAVGQYFVEHLPQGGRVVEITGTLGASASNERMEGFRDAIAANPGIQIVASQTGDYARDQELTVMQDYLQRFPSGQIDGVYAANDEMALGAIQAIEEAGRMDEMFVHGIDAGEDGLQAIKDGREAGTVVYPLNVPEGIVAAAKACAGEDLPKSINLVGPVVTPANIDEFLGTGF
jgi:ribose transport system substrate-binding protein